jgi:hypothetical protein
MTLAQVVQLAASIAAILFIAWLARRMGLGGDVRIRDAAHARVLAHEAVFGFEPVEIGIDRAGIAALMKDPAGRHLLIRRHGAQFAARLLDRHSESRLDRNFLTIGTGERLFGTITLDLGADAQNWASGLRHLAV